MKKVNQLQLEPKLLTPQFWHTQYESLRRGGDEAMGAGVVLAQSLFGQFRKLDDPEEFWNQDWPIDFDNFLELFGIRPCLPSYPYVEMIRDLNSLARIALEGDVYARLSVAQHPRTPLKTLVCLLWDTDFDVLDITPQIGFFEDDALDEMVKRGDIGALRDALLCGEFRPEILTYLNRLVRSEILPYITMNGEGIECLIESLRRDSDRKVRFHAYTRAGTSLALVAAQDPDFLCPYGDLWDTIHLSQTTYEDCILIIEIRPQFNARLKKELMERLLVLTSDPGLDDDKRVSAYLNAAVVADW